MVASYLRSWACLTLLALLLAATATSVGALPTPELAQTHSLAKRTPQQEHLGALAQSRDSRDLQQTPPQAALKRRSPALARTPMGRQPPRPRLMPFPALDEPLRRAGGLTTAFKSSS
ncbi:unnamed protein product [Parajaminaea phylloscopi]